MELHLTDAQQEKLTAIAEQQETTVGDLLIEAASMVIQIEDHRWEAIDRALAQVDRGNLIEEDEMDSRIDAMLKQK